jgi:hypothetical protein
MKVRVVCGFGEKCTLRVVLVDKNLSSFVCGEEVSDLGGASVSVSVLEEEEEDGRLHERSLFVSFGGRRSEEASSVVDCNREWAASSEARATSGNPSSSILLC